MAASEDGAAATSSEVNEQKSEKPETKNAADIEKVTSEAPSEGTENAAKTIQVRVPRPI